MKVDTSKISNVLSKLKKKDPVLFTAAQNKIAQIAAYDKSAFEHLKNLRHDLSDFKRVQV